MKALLDDSKLDLHEVLFWNNDGFCWLRGVAGAEREWSGKFSSLPEARKDCESKGFKPTAWVHVHG
jgi:hypothetical protein